MTTSIAASATPASAGILGVLALSKKHGPTVAEGAATAALELGVPTYRFLKRYFDGRAIAHCRYAKSPLSSGN